ncbi:glutamate--tRNA ligase [Candidatus Bathyarchaeota archaeon]|nr:MAG: glutamate--tRNA ligase [Candidatus Bathyarchaeota archaeon]
MLGPEVREALLKAALLNALKHGGRAKVGPVIGALLAERPDLKPLARQIVPLAQEGVAEVNKMSLAEQKALLEEKWPSALEALEERPEEREEERKLPPLPNVEKYGRVITRFAPNPDCVLHLGSARAIVLSHEYARMYKGLFYLRFEDTDPRTKAARLEFYDAILEDLEWLGCRPDKVFIQSDRLPIYYEHAERLLEAGKAYVCTCPRERFRELVMACRPCPCRSLGPEEHLERWEMMLDGTYGEGEAVVRIKTDLTHPNPAVRDWPALRIIDPEKHPHPRPEVREKGYRVWPLYNFACGIDDHLMGITHIIRGKEHLVNEMRQRYMYAHLGWRYPEAIHYGRLKIAGAVLSKSKIVAGVEKGLYTGWDDVRLATLRALRRRGITAEAIRRLMIDIGPKAADITISWENLYAINRKIIDPVANRYFFVWEPVELLVLDCPGPFTARLPLHPDEPERGHRELKVPCDGGRARLLISGSDAAEAREGELMRLIGLFNIEILSWEEEGRCLKARFHSEEYEVARERKARLIHWLPAEDNIRVVVLRPEGTVEGLGEPGLAGERVGALVQLVRYGFGRIDEVKPGFVRICYAHK